MTAGWLKRRRLRARLQDCDFERAAGAIRESLSGSVMPVELVTRLQAFDQSRDLSSAVELVTYDEAFAEIFERLPRQDNEAVSGATDAITADVDLAMEASVYLADLHEEECRAAFKRFNARYSRVYGVQRPEESGVFAVRLLGALYGFAALWRKHQNLLGYESPDDPQWLRKDRPAPQLWSRVVDLAALPTRELSRSDCYEHAASLTPQFLSHLLQIAESGGESAAAGDAGLRMLYLAAFERACPEIEPDDRMDVAALFFESAIRLSLTGVAASTELTKALR